jgi:hypothetical protein
VTRAATQVGEIDTLRARLAAVERRAARIARAAGVLAVLLASATVLAGVAVSRERRLPATTDSLEGRQIVLRDAAGKTRAVLGIRPDGSVGLVMNDDHAIPRAMLGLGSDGEPALGLSDRGGRLRAAIAVAADGSASVGFLDRAQTVRTTLGTGENGAPALSMRAEDGALLERMPDR